MVVFIQPAWGKLDASCAQSGLLQLPDAHRQLAIDHPLVILLFSELSGLLRRIILFTRHFAVINPPNDPT